MFRGPNRGRMLAHTEEFVLAQANEALRRLKHDEIRGAAVLRVTA